MWHKAEWMGRPMRLELTHVGLLVKLANRYTTKGALLYVYKALSLGSYDIETSFFVTF